MGKVGAIKLSTYNSIYIFMYACTSMYSMYYAYLNTYMYVMYVFM